MGNPLKVVITGPESTGKTTLAEALAGHYQTFWVKEYARIYLDQLQRPYQEDDLLAIAKGQLASEQAAQTKAGKLLICDTSLEVIKIWSEVKYKRCHPWILAQLRQQKTDLYLLCTPDMVWEYDPQRENPQDREALFTLYKQMLEGKNYVEIAGSKEKRIQAAIQAVDALLT